MPDYVMLVFTSDFMASYRRFSSADQGRVNRALERFEADERMPSLNVHQLSGKQAGTWAVYASKSLRITFERLDGGRKRLLEVSQHYGD